MSNITQETISPLSISPLETNDNKQDPLLDQTFSEKLNLNVSSMNPDNKQKLTRPIKANVSDIRLQNITSDSDTDDSTKTLGSFSELLVQNPNYYRHVIELENYITYHQACFSHKLIVLKAPSNLQIKHLKEKAPILAAIYTSYAEKLKAAKPIGQINDEVYISNLNNLIASCSEQHDHIPILNQHMFKFSHSYTQLGPSYRPPQFSQYYQRSRFDNHYGPRPRTLPMNRHVHTRGYFPNFVRPQVYRSYYRSPPRERNPFRQRSPTTISDQNTRIPANPHSELFPTNKPSASIKKDIIPIRTEIKSELDNILSSAEEIKPNLPIAQVKKIVPRHIKKRNKKLAKKSISISKTEDLGNTK